MNAYPDPLTAVDFSRIAKIAREGAGLSLDPRKITMVQSRLMRRVRRLNYTNFGAYLAHVESPDGAGERDELISLLTTNVTSFFREIHHIRLLEDRILPPLVQRALAGQRVRLWSAGCSFGNEAYSMAMVCRDLLGPRDDLDLRILATDIDKHALAHAVSASFPDDQIRPLPPIYRNRYLTRSNPGHWTVKPAVRSLIRFNHLNLLGDWPMTGTFDVVFCRNVLIYFDADTQDAVLRKFVRAIPEGGWLILGHSERLSPAVRPYFQSIGNTAFLRTPD